MKETMMEETDKLVLSAKLIINEVRMRHPKYRKFLDGVKVKVKSGMGLAAAMACTDTGKIYLNEDILTHADTKPSDFRDTVLHETAHVIANRLATGNVGHSVIWKSIAQKIGGTGNKSHSLSVSKEARKEFEDSLVGMPCPVCKERKLLLEPRQALKMLTGQQGYVCGDCAKKD